jgi:hypothetical protein
MIAHCARALLGLVLVSGLGCLGTRGGELPPIEAWPIGRGDAAKPIAVEITGFREWTPASGRRYRWRDVDAQYRADILGAFSDSGLFSSVSETSGPGDLRAHVQIEARETLKGVGWVTSLTLYLVPFGRMHTYDLELELIDPAGDATFTCQRTEASTLWWHLVFLFTWPFKDPLSVAPGVRYDLTRACLVEAAAAGAL